MRMIILMYQKTALCRNNMPKINHKLIRQVLQTVGITIFLISIFIKLKAIFLMGGTESFSDEKEESESGNNDNDDDDDDTDVEVDTPSPVTRTRPRR